MPKKCFVPGCSTGYDSNKAAQTELAAQGDPISIFLFPKDDTIRKQWLKNILRNAEDKSQTKRYVCSLHFKDTDYKTSKVCRGTEREVRSLKKDAVPTVFNTASYPSYMKDIGVKKRTTTMSSSEARRVGEWTKHKQETEAWLALDKFTSLEDLKEKVAKVNLFPGFRLTLDKDEMGERQYLTIFTYEPQQDLMDNILRITDNGTFVMYKHGAKIAKSRLRDIIHSHKDRFTTVSQVMNAVAFLKNLRVEDKDQIKKTSMADWRTVVKTEEPEDATSTFPDTTTAQASVFVKEEEVDELDQSQVVGSQATWRECYVKLESLQDVEVKDEPLLPLEDVAPSRQREAKRKRSGQESHSAVKHLTTSSAASHNGGSNSQYHLPRSSEGGSTTEDSRKSKHNGHGFWKNKEDDRLLTLGGKFEEEKPEDEDDIFGKYVAAKLKTMETSQRIFAEKIINDAIFAAQLGKLNRDSRIALAVETPNS